MTHSNESSIRSSTELLLWLTDSTAPIQCVNIALTDAVLDHFKRDIWGDDVNARDLDMVVTEEDSGLQIVVTHGDFLDSTAEERLEFPFSPAKFEYALCACADEIAAWLNQGEPDGMEDDGQEYWYSAYPDR